MKILFYFTLFLLLLFELLSVYLIMPMPGSQRLQSLDLAYFLYVNRWAIRLVLILILLISIVGLIRGKKFWLPVTTFAVVLALMIIFKVKMSADQMFLQPEILQFSDRQSAELPDSALVLSVQINGNARAYPIRYIQYHHQVRDQLEDKDVMVTYCNVCRSGRIFDPHVKGEREEFRLVGMNHYNAMFEDSKTGSWWRQANGEAVAGPLKGTLLEEIPSMQHSLASFFTRYPNGEVMQPDPRFIEKYDSLGAFERGTNSSELTGTDSSSWNEKSWVIGINGPLGPLAYDWNKLEAEQFIYDQEEGVLVVLWEDGSSFAAYDLRDVPGPVSLSGDSLHIGNTAYDFHGTSTSGKTRPLLPLQAYQEFWHSWRTFHPDTQRRN